MKVRINSDIAMPIAALVLMSAFIAACAIQLRNDEAQGPESSLTLQEMDPFADKLARCLMVTSEQPTEMEACRRIWAQNRRRFLTSATPDWSVKDDTPITSGTKYQDRILPSEITRGSSGGR